MILGFTQLLIISAITFYEFKNRSSSVFLWASLLVMFGLMHFVSYFLPDYIYEDVLDQASIFAILFCAVYFVTRVMLSMFVRREKDLIYASTRYEDRFIRISKILLLISVLAYGGYLVRTGGSLLRLSKETVYLTMAKSSKFFLLSTYCYYSSAPVFIYCMLQKRRKDALYFALLVAARSLLSNTRMDMMVIFVGIIAYIIFNSDRNLFIKLLILAISGIITIFMIYSLRVFRYYYGIKNLGSINASDFFGYLGNFLRNDDGELGLRRVFYFFLENNNEFPGFGTGNGYKRVLLFMIPGSLLGGLKPEDMCVVMGRAWRPNLTSIIGFTITPTLFGDCYANLGFSGFLLGIFWGVVVTVLDAIVNRKSELMRTLLFGMTAIEYVDIGRGSVYNPICHIWYCSIIVYFMYIFSAKVRFKIKH